MAPVSYFSHSLDHLRDVTASIAVMCDAPGVKPASFKVIENNTGE